MVKPRECSYFSAGWSPSGGGGGLVGGRDCVAGREDRTGQSLLWAALTLHTAALPGPSLWVWVRPSCPSPSTHGGHSEPAGSAMVWAEMRSVGVSTVVGARDHCSSALTAEWGLCPGLSRGTSVLRLLSSFVPETS